MKTIKKIVPFFILACFLGGIAVSCEDDCGCEPKISHVITSSMTTPEDSLIVATTAGSTIIIVGENLASVTGISFGNNVATLNSSFITDNAIIVQVPSTIATTTTEMILTTAQGRTVPYPFAVNIPAPLMTMFYSEFVEENDILRIKGDFFFDPHVFFYGEDGSEIEGEVVEVVGSKEVKVIVPPGVADSRPVKMVTQAGSSESGVKPGELLFRDRRNIIIDFDDLLGRDITLLTQKTEETAEAGPTWKDRWKESAELFDWHLPEKACSGWYGGINQLGYVEPGGYIGTDPERSSITNLVGPFMAEGINNLVLKFEIYVPASHPITGVTSNIYLTPVNFGGTSDLGRDLTKRTAENGCVPGAYWHPFVLRIDKTTDPNSWAPDKSPTEKAFFTEGWMTVAIPLSSFQWNISEYGIYEQPLNTFGGEAALAAVTSLDPTNIYDFAFMWNNHDGEQAASTFLGFFDNFRIVPENGGGAVLGKYGAREGSESWIPGVTLRYY